MYVLVDDRELEGDIPLLRQINPNPAANNVDWEDLDAGGFPRLRSAAFQRASKKIASQEGYPEQTLSVYLERVVLDSYGSVEAWLRVVGRPGYGVARVTAQQLRQLGSLSLRRDDHRGFIGHCVGWAAESGSKSRAGEPALAEVAEWVVKPQHTTA